MLQQQHASELEWYYDMAYTGGQFTSNMLPRPHGRRRKTALAGDAASDTDYVDGRDIEDL
eukprot:m.868956 g.868956  ORF g.868956 m.868956 type:complete len:60 (+) comp23563_c2_seq45:232-411(+)